MTTTATAAAPTAVNALHPLLAGRWSPRAFDAAHDVSDDTVSALLEAARWAPSAANTQPWRFLVTRRGDRDFARLFETLADGNKLWAYRAGALVLVAAETTDPAGRPRSHALYDTGLAVAQLVSQAQAEGLVTHQMGGFDPARAALEFWLPTTLTPVVVVAVGRHDPSAELPEALAAREVAPRTRLPIGDLLIATDYSGERAA